MSAPPRATDQLEVELDGAVGVARARFRGGIVRPRGVFALCRGGRLAGSARSPRAQRRASHASECGMCKQAFFGATKLGLARAEPTDATRIIILDVPVKGRTLGVGFVADRVFEVTGLDADQTEAAPDVGGRWQSNYIAGIGRKA